MSSSDGSKRYTLAEIFSSRAGINKTAETTAAAKSALIEALRSGKYRQIRGRSWDGHDGYCVMGLVGHLGLDLAVQPSESSALIHMNDRLCLTFAEIADRIEAGDYEVEFEPPSPGDAVAALAAFAELAGQTTSDEGPRSLGDDEPPPQLPVLIFIVPRRPVLTGATGRRLPGRARTLVPA